MTAEAIRIAKEALELAEKATPGPWKMDHDWTLEVIDRDEHNVAKLPHHMASTPSNAAFIAFARTAIPILARAVLESRSAEQEAPSANGPPETTQEWPGPPGYYPEHVWLSGQTAYSDAPSSGTARPKYIRADVAAKAHPVRLSKCGASASLRSGMHFARWRRSEHSGR